MERICFFLCNLLVLGLPECLPLALPAHAAYTIFLSLGLCVFHFFTPASGVFLDLFFTAIISSASNGPHFESLQLLFHRVSMCAGEASTIISYS